MKEKQKTRISEPEVWNVLTYSFTLNLLFLLPKVQLDLEEEKMMEQKRKKEVEWNGEERRRKAIEV